MPFCLICDWSLNSINNLLIKLRRLSHHIRCEIVAYSNVSRRTNVCWRRIRYWPLSKTRRIPRNSRTLASKRQPLSPKRPLTTSGVRSSILGARARRHDNADDDRRNHPRSGCAWIIHDRDDGRDYSGDQTKSPDKSTSVCRSRLHRPTARTRSARTPTSG